MSTADDLRDDVVERAAKAMYGNASPATRELVRHRLAALLDDGIVALVPDPDTDAIDALDEAICAVPSPSSRGTLNRLNRAGWTVAPLPTTTEPCWSCEDSGRIGQGESERDCPHCSTTVPCDECWEGVNRHLGPNHPLTCPACSGRQPAASRAHDHDTSGCTGCRDVVLTVLHNVDKYRSLLSVTPPPADLPGDGWEAEYDSAVKAERAGCDDCSEYRKPCTYHEGFEWGYESAMRRLHPDPDPEPEPRPTYGWDVQISQVDGQWAGWSGWFGWALIDDGHNVMSSDTERTRAEAEAAAQAARTAWDTRLAGGAS